MRVAAKDSLVSFFLIYFHPTNTGSESTLSDLGTSVLGTRRWLSVRVRVCVCMCVCVCVRVCALGCVHVCELERDREGGV